MNDYLRRHYEMLLRVRDYGVQYTASFPIGTRGHELFADLSSIVTEIEQLAAAQQSNSRSAREGTTQRGEARTELREQMEAISDTARSMALDTTGLEDKFRMPRGRPADLELLSTARAFATDALQLTEQFINYGMPADFLDRLNAAIETLEQAIDSQQRSRRSQVSATSGLDETVERGVNKVRQLDAIVRNTFRNQPAQLSEWETARHTERPPQPPAPPAAPPPATAS